MIFFILWVVFLPVLCVRGGVSVEAEPAVVVPPLDRFAEDGVGHVHRHHLLHGRLVADHVGVELETTQVITIMIGIIGRVSVHSLWFIRDSL